MGGVKRISQLFEELTPFIDSRIAQQSAGGGVGVAASGGSGGVSVHSALTGLNADDHPLYHTDARGDVRYYRKSEADAQYVKKSGDVMTGNLSAPRIGIGTTSPLRSLDVGLGQITFKDDVVSDSTAGIFWHTGSAYGIYRTPGAWTGNYQQLKVSFDTGIILQPGPTGSTGYGKSYVEIGGGGKGLRVTSGDVGIGTASPVGGKLNINGGHINLGGNQDPSVNQGEGNWITWGYRSDNQAYYAIRPQYRTYGSTTYPRLQLAWHTGVEIGAASTYGGVRFFNNSPFTGTQIASIGDGNDHARFYNFLKVGANTSPTQALDVMGNALISGSVTAANDMDVTHRLGRAFVGFAGHGDYAGFGHLDYASTGNYALLQGGAGIGNTFLNAPTGQAIYHRINNSDVMAMTDMRLNPAGTIQKDLGDYNRKWRSIFAAELVVETLVAQDVMATIGGRIMVAPTTALLADVSAVATTIDTKHNNLHSGTGTGVIGHYVLLETAPGGIAQFEVMRVADGVAPVAITGGWRYTVTRNHQGTGAKLWYAGDAVVSLKRNDGGWIELTSTATRLQHLGPTQTIYARRSGNAWNDVAPVVATGNLRSFVDYTADRFGIAHGNDLALSPSSGFSGLTSDASSGMRLFNTAISLYSSGAKTLDVSPTLGITLYSGADMGENFRYLNFATSAGTKFGSLRGYHHPTSNLHTVAVSVEPLWAGSASEAYISASTQGNARARVGLGAYGYGAPVSSGLNQSTIDLYAKNGDDSNHLIQAISRAIFLDGDVYIRNSASDLPGIKFTQTWSGYPGNTYGSEISNDTSGYKTLMIVGNRSNGGARRVSVWDEFWIGNLVKMTASNGNSLRIDSTGGWMMIGAQNEGWSHFYTDRPRYYFDKGITSGANQIGSYDNALQLQVAGVTRAVIDTNGRLGIGVSSPGSLLEVANGANEVRFPGGNDGVLGQTHFNYYADKANYLRGTTLIADSGGDVHLASVSGKVYIYGALGLWAALPLATGWANYAGYRAAQYKKVGDMVWLRGLVQRTSGTATTICQLPVGFRPLAREVFAAATGAATAAGRIDIDTLGNVILVVGTASYASLNGICFSVI